MKPGDWVLLIGIVIGGGGLSGAVGSLLVPLLRRPAIKAEATARITGAASVLIDQLQEEVTAARTEAQGARREAREAGQEASAARLTVRNLGAEVDELTHKLHRLIGWIHEPTMNIEQLRRLVPMPPSENGVGRR